MVVILGQQYHVGAFFCGTIYLLMVITSSAVTPSVQANWRLRRQSMHLPIFCRGSCCGSGWCNKASRISPRLTGVQLATSKIVYRKMIKICQPPHHLGEFFRVVYQRADTISIGNRRSRYADISPIYPGNIGNPAKRGGGAAAKPPVVPRLVRGLAGGAARGKTFHAIWLHFPSKSGDNIDYRIVEKGFHRQQHRY